MSAEEHQTGKCDKCSGDLARVTDTTAHTYLGHTLSDCLTHERDAALKRAERAENLNRAWIKAYGYLFHALEDIKQVVGQGFTLNGERVVTRIDTALDEAKGILNAASATTPEPAEEAVK